MKRLTKDQKEYNRDVDAYKWFVIKISDNSATSGWEFKSDANDALKEANEYEKHKIVHRSRLAVNGIVNPCESWKYKTN